MTWVVRGSSILRSSSVGMSSDDLPNAIATVARYLKILSAQGFLVCKVLMWLPIGEVLSTLMHIHLFKQLPYPYLPLLTGIATQESGAPIGLEAVTPGWCSK